ncbi:MAG: M20 family metallopeptidase [Paludisphaera borealis]|uniref:M20 family metallopeptidase n=1 Tax=Paludisphaera borealis TaxID=1387353 RepID=UPI002846AA42|nr:M20 family metallopeptidase [Paludisphaera borealis]MDR3619493.1 M20 family metallopeptidase [Paludisphaera borealis]
MSDLAIRAYVEDHVEAYLAELTALAEHESPSRDKPRLDALAATIAGRWASLGGIVEIVANPQGGDHIIARFGRPTGQRPSLVLGHFDTVWPVGTLGRMPVRREAGRLHGPGIYDMKASLVLFSAVLEALEATERRLTRPVVALFTSDEEIGSPTSRSLIEQIAAESAHVFVLEPPLADGSLKTARKGVGRFTMTVEGKAAHAGVSPEKGASAIVELAHQILGLQTLNDPAAGTTLNVGLIQGGTTPNVVPAHASAEIDVRAVTRAGAEKVERALSALVAVTPGTRLSVTGGFNRPPMERTEAVAALFEQARRVGRGLGLKLTEGSTGGGSDGNFTAALGVPTLDGLGVEGGGAHADDEHIVIDSFSARASLLADLILEL